ncbi:type II toxin-antitoxin system VapC family toxin [Nocardiopsis trehalosi]|uniref:type II toxin-antitoxin system VapC family toxin n=1 Tax=Nocardiopsis trehalosi TaxID=109329 RepID=UPI000A783ECB|nr:PIN domain-containing protein [Nocardiopsis trehalosi]
MTLVVDAGPLYALVDADDDHHEAVARLFSRHRGPLVVPTLVIAEVAYLVGERIGTRAELALLDDLADGVFDVEPVHRHDWSRIRDLVEKYADLPIGATDASVIAAAERLHVTEVATLDRRHFSVVRPRHVDAFTLLP